MPNEEQADEHATGDLLPPELLTEIFLQVVPAPRTIYTEDSTTLPDYDHKPIFALSQVCSYWRSVTLSMPSLWTTIPFIYRKYRRNPSDGFLALVRLFIERSGSTPIHITISLGESVYFKWSKELIQHPAIDLILSHSHRWKTAIVHLNYDLLPLLGKLESENKSLLPILEGLNVRVWSFYRRRIRPTGPKNIFANAPALRHAIIDGLRNRCLNFPWSQLTTYVGLPMGLDSLRPAGAQLTTLVLRGPLLKWTTMIYPSSPLQFPQLTTLRVQHTHRQFHNEFLYVPDEVFAYIVAPNLLCLEIFSHPSFSKAPEIVGHLISTTLSQCSPLQSLSFHVAGLTVDLLEILLDMTPSLLSLDIGDISPKSLLSLIFDTTLTPHGLYFPRVPQLESLTIRGLSDMDVGPLVDVYISRRRVALQDNHRTKVPCIKLTYPSRFSFWKAQDRFENWARKGREKSSEYIKMIGWRNYLAKQFLSRASNVAKEYAISGTPALWRKFLCQDMSKMDTFFKIIESYELEDVELLEVSRLTTIIHGITGMHDGVIPEDDIYHFRQRARSLLDKWTPLLDAVNPRRGWVVDDDGLGLRFVGSVEC